MDLPPIVCAACGATYKHPGKAGKTKCQKCGAPMTVALPAAVASAPAPSAAPRAVVAPPGPAPRQAPAVVSNRGPGGRPLTHGPHHGHAPRGRSGSNAVLIWSCAGLLVVAGVVALVMALKSDDSAQQMPANTPVKTAEKSSGKNMWEGFGEAQAGGEKKAPPPKSGAAAKDSGEPQGVSGEGKPQSGTSESPRPAPAAATAEKHVKLDRYRNLAKLAPAPGCAADRAMEIAALVKATLDTAYPAEANRARYKLVDQGKDAIPLVINGFLDLDLESLDRTVINSGNILNEILVDITGIRRGFDDRREDEEGVVARMRCRHAWHQWWEKEGATWQPPKSDEDG